MASCWRGVSCPLPTHLEEHNPTICCKSATRQAPPVPLLGIAFVEDEVEILNDPTSLCPAGLYSGENSIAPALIFLSIVCGLHVQPSALAPANAQKTIPFRVLVMG